MVMVLSLGLHNLHVEAEFTNLFTASWQALILAWRLPGLTILQQLTGPSQTPKTTVRFSRIGPSNAR